MTSLPSRDLVLIGAGHTNLHVVRMWRMRPIPDVRLTVVSPFSRATYSGMLPGTLAGLYQPGDMEIDLYRFTESCGARLIVGEAIGFDPEIRRVLFADRPPLRYDVASIGIGSVPGQRELWANNPHVLSIKPMATFRARFEASLKTVLERSSTVRLAVVGAGAGGTEVALGLDAWLGTRGIDRAISMVDANTEILAGYSAGTKARARDEFARRSLQVLTAQRVQRIGGAPAPDDGAVITLEDGKTLAADIVIWATVAAPPPVLANYRLPKSADGFLEVAATLKTTADFPVFAVGDTASIVGQRLPRAGVYAVREGPVLWENVQRIFDGRGLVPYEPQRGFLSLLSTGDGQAIAEYKGFSGRGRWAWKWKDYIDRKFMRMYQDYSPRAEMRTGSVDSRMGPSHDGAMRCAGCGSKVGANILAAALERLNIPADARTAVGLARPDDAAVLDRTAAPVDVLSVDFFPAFLDDPYLVGRIAALNALSDLWAMGSAPLGAMAIVTVPEGSPAQQTEVLYQLLAGGLRELTAAGAALWGGHTTEGPELTIGYTVAGRLDGRVPFTKGSLRPGDRLVLTKPLGTATLLAAHRQSLCRALWMESLLKVMLSSNAAASAVARELELPAVTDITGFGLAGHLFEMLDASGVSARLSLDMIPLLEGFAELSAAGVRSSLDAANRTTEARCRPVQSGLTSRPAYHALFDPQTCGGLLIGVPAASEDDLIVRLKERGMTSACLIGEVLESSGEPILELQ